MGSDQLALFRSQLIWFYIVFKKGKILFQLDKGKAFKTKVRINLLCCVIFH